MKFDNFIESQVKNWQFLYVRVEIDGAPYTKDYIIKCPTLDSKRQVIEGEFYDEENLKSSNPKDRFPIAGLSEVQTESIITFGKPEFIYNDNAGNPFKRCGIKLKDSFVFNFDSSTYRYW